MIDMAEIKAYIAEQSALSSDPSQEADPVERDFMAFEKQAVQLHQVRQREYQQLDQELSGLRWEYRRGDVAPNFFRTEERRLEARLSELRRESDAWAEEARTRRLELERYRWSIDSPRKTYGPPDTVQRMMEQAA